MKLFQTSVMSLLVLASSAVCAKEAPAYQGGTVTNMFSTECFDHKRGTDELCPEYTVAADSDEYLIQIKNEKEPHPLTVGEKVQFRFKKKKVYMRTLDCDGKEHEYSVVATPEDYFGPVHTLERGISAPEVVKQSDPEFSDEARKLKYQGAVELSAVIDPSGRAKNIRVTRKLGKGLDEKAVEALRKWVFKPSQKDGHPVAVLSNLVINFRLY
ncbi:MAG: hypothetical protein NVS9B15_15860 [Acidobacteriaceae bacterium]